MNCRICGCRASQGCTTSLSPGVVIALCAQVEEDLCSICAARMGLSSDDDAEISMDEVEVAGGVL